MYPGKGKGLGLGLTVYGRGVRVWAGRGSGIPRPYTTPVPNGIAWSLRPAPYRSLGTPPGCRARSSSSTRRCGGGVAAGPWAQTLI